MLSQARELEFLKLLDRLSRQLKHMQDPQKALRQALRDTSEFLDARHGCVAVVQSGRPAAKLLMAIPDDAPWDLDLLARFIRYEHPAIGNELLIRPLQRRGKGWGAM